MNRDDVVCGLNQILGELRDMISAEYSIDEPEPEANRLFYYEKVVECTIKIIQGGG